MGYIFGGSSGVRTPQEAARLRAIADALAAHPRAPHTIGEGLSAIGDAIAQRRASTRADRIESEGRAAWQKKYGGLLPELMGGGGAVDPVPTAPGGVPPPAPDLSQANPEYLTGGGMPPPPTMENVANAQLPPAGDVSISSYSPPEEPIPAEDAASAMATGQPIPEPPPIQTAGLSITGSDLPQPEPQQPGVQLAGGAGFDPRIAEALSDPWLPEGQKAVLQAILEQQLKANEPVDYGFTAQGTDIYRTNPRTGQVERVIDNPDKTLNPTPDMQNFQFDKANGYEGSFHKWLEDKKKTGPLVSIGPQGEQLPAPPSGFAYVHGPDGKVLFDDRGVPQILPMQGTKEYRDAQKAAEAAGSGQQQKEQSADIVIQDADRAMAIVKKNPEWTTGLGGQLLAGVGGTTANNTRELIDTVKANVGFDRLQQMRAASPTGGALGPVSDFENKMLQSVIGSLEQSQTADQLLFNLKRVKAIYSKIINEGIKPGDPIPTADEETNSGPPKPGDIEDGHMFKGGDPADRNNWVPVS